MPPVPFINQLEQLFKLLSTGMPEGVTTRPIHQQLVPEADSLPTPPKSLSQYLHMMGNALNMNQQQHALIDELLDCTLSLDTVTGLAPPYLYPEMIGMMQLFSQTQNIPGCLIQADFSNLRGCNELIGKEATNQLMRLCCEIYQKHLWLSKPKCGYGVRNGGDEFQFVVTGLSEAEVNHAINQAEVEITLLIENIGLSDLQHQKYPNDQKRRGAGAKAATLSLSRLHSADDLGCLDQMIDAKKLAAGTERLQCTGKTTRELASYTKVEIAAIVHRIKRYAQRYHCQLEQTYQSTARDKLTVPTDADELLKMSLREQRLHRLNSRIEQQNLTPPQLALLINIYEHVCEWQQPGLALERADDFLLRLNQLSATNKLLVKLEAQNFAGLNKFLGHVGADHVYQMMVNELNRTSREEGLAISWFGRPNGKIVGIATDTKIEKMDDFIKQLQAAITKNILSLPLAKIAEAAGVRIDNAALDEYRLTPDSPVSSIPYIRGHGEKRGTDFVCAVVLSTPHDRPQEKLAELDCLIAERKLDQRMEATVKLIR